MSVAASSQFASALLLASRTGGWTVDIARGGDAEELPYVEMTRELMRVFPARGGEFQVEPDASSGSYFLSANKLLKWDRNDQNQICISVNDWPKSGWQMDARFHDYAFQFIDSRQTISRQGDLGDSIMTAIVMAPLEPWMKAGKNVPKQFTHLGRLRVQECERVKAISEELMKCGARVIEAGDTLTVYPSQLHGAEIETYNDHRMAMSLALVGLKVPGGLLPTSAITGLSAPGGGEKDVPQLLPEAGRAPAAWAGGRDSRRRRSPAVAPRAGRGVIPALLPPSTRAGMD